MHPRLKSTKSRNVRPATDDQVGCTSAGDGARGTPVSRLRGRAVPDARLLDKGPAPRRRHGSGTQRG